METVFFAVPCREGGIHSLTNATWRSLLSLALVYGWQPAGTQKLDPTDVDEEGNLGNRILFPGRGWDGNYLTAECQLVTREDASGIANALEVALDDLGCGTGTPREGPSSAAEYAPSAPTWLVLARRRGDPARASVARLQPFEFSRQEIEDLQASMDFFRQGAFCIG